MLESSRWRHLRVIFSRKKAQTWCILLGYITSFLLFSLLSWFSCGSSILQIQVFFILTRNNCLTIIKAPMRGIDCLDILILPWLVLLLLNGVLLLLILDSSASLRSWTTCLLPHPLFFKSLFKLNPSWILGMFFQPCFYYSWSCGFLGSLRNGFTLLFLSTIAVCCNRRWIRTPFFAIFI